VRIRIAGKPLDPRRRYKIATSDFLASGGNGVFGPLKLPEKATQVTDTIIREAFRDVLRGWKGKATLDPAKLYAPSARRLDYEGTRPLACGSEEPSKEKEQ
jgi:2',3'-cyclic-nucleotide 2'-phosphodiesterase (5'-nucleotidase family)